MNSQVCVNCRNNKPVNHTNNRLVTENCGHTKCMDCLLQEKSGCSACLREKDKLQDTKKLSNGDSESEQNNEPLSFGKESPDGSIACENLEKKKKCEVPHVKTETDESGKYYFCTLCKKKFHAKNQVAYHAYCNGQRKPFQCPECNKSFAAHSHFKYHMRVHRNERTYSCEVCGDSFFQMSKLQRHKLKHTNEKKFVCAQCNKGFNSLSSLRKHELTHTEVRPFACAICGSRFRDSSNYRKHVAKHDDKKCGCSGGCSRCARGASAGAGAGAGRAHQCPRCARAFHSRKDMRRHVAVHIDSKPFRCKVCSRRFRRKDNLERHIRNTHPDYVPASAVDCDLLALKQISSTHESDSKPQNTEKTLLKILNPLPPLSQDVIQKHIIEGNENLPHTKKEEKLNKSYALLKTLNPLPQLSQDDIQKHIECNENLPHTKKDEKLDKSYILEANNARQSVIVGNYNDKKIPSPQGNEYVHKIRKANSMATQTNIPLPPIDETKIIELEQKTSLNNLDLGAPPKDVELYKKILYGKSEADSDTAQEKERKEHASPEMHWRRKMKLNINW